MFISAAQKPPDVKTVSMICVMLVSVLQLLGLPRRLRAVPISVACETYWMFCGDVYLICEPLLLRPPYMDDIVNSLSIRSYRAVLTTFALGWPPGTRRNLGCYLYHSEKTLTHPAPMGLTGLLLDM